MPELPEVETVRRMLETHVVGRTVRAVRLSGLALREQVSRGLARGLRGRSIRGVSRRGKFLVFERDEGLALLSRLGMSGRWLFSDGERVEPLPHIHARIGFTDGIELRFRDPRRFGLLRLVRAEQLARDRAIASTRSRARPRATRCERAPAGSRRASRAPARIRRSAPRLRPRARALRSPQLLPHERQHRAERRRRTCRAMEETKMVMTILEARVAPERVGDLERAYREAVLEFPPGLVETFLARDTGDPAVFRIMTVWASRDALEKMRASGVKPKGVQIFEAAGATPTLSIFEVVQKAGVS
ncbi:MAG TPA: DNA-formamidopyrimidine glycosylase family protein [Candidatus Eisenbacteria bacterium]|jgi:heme-degrading monooxygenase HmoA